MTTMTEQTVAQDKSFGFSNLYLDFINRNPKLDKYIISSGPAEAAAKIQSARIDRDRLCDIMVDQNREFGSRPLAFENIEKLRDEKALCIFSGQQAGLLGGPLLTLYKAVDVVKRAVYLEKELRRPVVPIFWIACDDHDFQEINHTFTFDPAGEPIKISYDVSDELPVPVADIDLGEGEDYRDFERQVTEGFGGRDLEAEHLGRLLTAYAPKTNLVKAFATFINDILPDLGLVIFCPHNTEIKTMSKGFFKEIIERHFSVKERLQEMMQSLQDDEYHIQAVKKESAAHLFFHDPGRTPIHYLDDNFVIGDKRLGLSGMLDLIDKYPERFSPDVLTRPIWQSFMFPVVAQSGGPAEIAYFCQIGKLFELFNTVQPYYYPRIGATIIESRQEDTMERYNIGLADLTGDIEQIFNRISSESFPPKLEARITDFKDQLEKNYFEFADAVSEYESSLKPMVKQTFGKIEFAVKNLEKKIFAQHKRRTETVRHQLRRLSSGLYPNRDFQERWLNINYYIAKYGFGVVDYIISKLDVNTREHQLIHLSRYVK